MTYNATAPVSPSRAYQYDTLGRPTSRTLTRQGATRNDVFTYNDRSELISDVVDGTGLNGWDYDNIGNRLVQQQGSACDTYTSNALNQYTAIEDESHDVFTPTYDADGNQTRIKTSTGIWNVAYNAKNRPILFTKDDNSVSVACTYDYMGRRATKVVTENGQITSSHRFLYRGYLQIACCDRTRANHPCLWLITWDPTQPVATRPLAIQKDSTWYTYGWDLTKNIWEAYTTTGYIGTAYTYTAYGQVTANGSITQPIQWSSEYNDSELALVYYNYRHYNPIDGRGIGRDMAKEYGGAHLYLLLSNLPIIATDMLGLKDFKCNAKNINKYKDLNVEIYLQTLMDEYLIANTDDFHLNKHIISATKEILKDKSEEFVDQLLRENVESYEAIKEFMDGVNRYMKKMRGGLPMEAFAEIISSAGGVIQYFSAKVSASICCCTDHGYSFQKASGEAQTKDYNVSIKNPTEKQIIQIKTLPDDLAKMALDAVTSLNENKCK